MFVLTAATTLMLAVVIGSGAAAQTTGALTVAAVVAAFVLEVMRHGRAPGTGRRDEPEEPAAPAPSEPAEAAAPGVPEAAAPGKPEAAAPGKPEAAAPGVPEAAAPGVPAAAVPGRSRRWARRLPWLALPAGLLAIALTGIALHRGEATPTATMLGQPDFDGYCRATGQGPVRLTAANAYGWQCSAASSLGDDATAVCAWTFHSPHVISRVADFNDPSSWQCWRITRRLGPLDFNAYCRQTGHPGASYVDGHDVYGWYCSGSGEGIDAQRACATQYRQPAAVSRFRDYYDKGSWECWA